MLPVQFSDIFVLFCWLIISVEECKSAVVFLKLSSAMMEESVDGDTDIMEDEEIKESAKTIVGRSPYSRHYKEILNRWNWCLKQRTSEKSTAGSFHCIRKTVNVNNGRWKHIYQTNSSMHIIKCGFARFSISNAVLCKYFMPYKFVHKLNSQLQMEA